MFEVGAKVRHERFGVGIVLEAESVTFSGHPSQDLQIDFGGKVGVKGYYCPPARLRKVAPVEAPTEEAAPVEAPTEEAAPESVPRVKLRKEWGGPTMITYNRHLDSRDKSKIQEMLEMWEPTKEASRSLQEEKLKEKLT